MLAAMYSVLIWAQINKGNQPFGNPAGGANAAQADGLMAMLAGMGIGFAVFFLIVIAFSIVIWWKIFTKAGEPGWASLVPIYQGMILSKICGRGEMFGLLLLVPCVNIIIMFMLVFDLAKVFGKSGGFAVGMLLLGIVFLPILAFGSAEYVGADGKSPGRRRRRDEDDEDDDEEEEERPRRPAAKDPRTQQRPSAPPPAAPKRRPPVEDDDDEEEERPRPRKR
jgi:Family of unknown function (DUF5684)